ncbi:hypothetical protein [Bradyrhizobium sp. 2TAF24]|uniref:hypothetical protein n=1 Tax=Bradyrhizobium sp. 2TAF24 TaxID=3233011 RepID=UPI003F92AF3A
MGLIAITWSIAAPLLFLCGLAFEWFTFPSSWPGMVIYAVAMLCWYASLAWVYRAFFRWAEAHWPRATIIRQILSAVLASLLAIGSSRS